MPRPAPLSGFPELLPGQRAVEQHVLDALRTTFELHGFAGLETRAVEPLGVLLRKGEIDKEVYVVRRLHAEGDAGSDADALALHFDLTVPFARYVTENAGHLHFPFRRYQIQKVWRGERPQEGRYREFTQADIDVVDAGTLAVHHDAEMARVMAAALAQLPLPPVRLQINNRKLIEGFYRGLGLDDDGVGATMRAVDKLDKIGADGVGTLLAQAGLGGEQVRSALALAAVRGVDTGVADAVAALGVRHPLLEEGLEELVAVLAGVADLRSERVAVVADLSIARGLDYYTGTVYETRMSGYESLGSICSGGRYDSLADDGRTTYPGVGISLGVTRALAPLFGRGVLAASRPTPTAVVVAVADEGARPAADAVAAALRTRGIATEVSPTAAKFGKQIRYADRRGIPFVWFPPADGSGADGSGAGHEVKDIRTGEQVPADPAAWLPPTEDLRPAVVLQAVMPADPVAVGVALGRELGLPVQQPRVLHRGANVVVHLAPAPVVARVAALTARARPRPGEALRREVDLSGWLAARGAPVVPPTSVVDPGPHERSGRWASLWPLLDLPSGGGHATGAPELVAGALAALHAAAAPYPTSALPGLAEVVGDGRRALVSGGGWLPAEVRTRLEAAGGRAGATAAAVDAGSGRRALHGDAHPRNLLRVAGSVLWCDLEDAVAGPVEWDLAVVARSRRHDGAAAVRAYTAVTGVAPDAALLSALVGLRAWQVACWEVLFADEEPDRRPDVLAHLSPELGVSDPLAMLGT